MLNLSKITVPKVLKKAIWLGICTAGLWGTLISAGMCQEKIFKFPYTSNETVSNVTNEFYKDSQFIVFFNRLFSTILAGFILLFQVNAPIFEVSVQARKREPSNQKLVSLNMDFAHSPIFCQLGFNTKPWNSSISPLSCYSKAVASCPSWLLALFLRKCDTPCLTGSRQFYFAPDPSCLCWPRMSLLTEQVRDYYI